MQKRYIAICAAAAVSAAAQGAPGFSHEMPKGTNEKPLDTPYAEMAETFRNPFDKVQTGCYWYWMGGNISCDGVRKDLEAMKKAGIDRPYIGDIGGGGNKKGPVKTLSPEWNEVLQTAFSTASRLGIEIGLFNSPGWSQSGGPWVKPEMAMRRVVSSVVVVDGPSDGVVLPAPKFEYAPQKDMRDVCAIAYPVPKGIDGRLEKRAAKDAPLEAAKDKPLVVELASPEPFEAQSAEIVLASGKGSGEIIVEAETDGAWKRICKMPYSRYNHGPGVGFAPHAPIFAAFSPTTAKRFRVTVSTTRTDAAAGFASVAVCTAPRVGRAVEKSLGKMHETPLPMWKEYKWPVEMECAEKTALDPSKAVVLTGKVAPDGKLDWKVPAGTWAIYRIAYAPTGTKNGPANPEATGYEVDKMSREHIAAHFDAYLGKILEATPPESRKAIRHAVLDSYEQGGQNFTDRFAEKFKASFGYDPTPYFPVLHGMAVGSRADSDRFLWDLRRFVADEVAYSYVGGLRKASNAHGMETWLECYGHWGFPGEFLQYGGQSDGIAGEYWCEGSLGDIENRAASSCAHIYGRRLVWAESNTSGHNRFERGPMDLKQRTDRFFAEGLNATILHVYIQQESDRKPGRIAWFGEEFNRHNTWFEHFDLFTGYLKRCGWMLRQGLNVADVAYFIGEDAPCMTGVCDPALPAGRQFDYINAEVLTETARVDEEGRIVLPHGTAYEVLVLPKLETMRPKMAECVERLVNAGATVIGPRPTRSPSLAGQPESDAKVKEIADRLWGEEECKVESVKCKVRKYGKGVIASGISLEEALKMRGSEPDVILHSTLYTLHSSLAYAHRTMPKAEIYFISNQSGKEIPSVDVSFRVAGRVPELWDAATGESRAAEKWREENGRTAVTLSLAKHESVFVVFPAEKGNGEWGTGNGLNPVNPVNPVKNNLISGPWTVSFESDELHRGPKDPVKFDKLIDLSTSDDPAIKYYSGKLVYRTTFTLPPSSLPSTLSLDLGEVSVTAKVKVNGKDAGGVCFAPYRLDIAPFVKAGENDLEIEVCNLWVNRLVGDDGLENRPTWTSIPCADKKRTKLHKSGLLGPVSIQYRTAEKVDAAKTAARADGGIDFQKLIDEAAAKGGGRVVVPAGVHETKSLRLRSHVELHLEKGAVLRGSVKHEDYFDFPADVCAVRPESSGLVLIYAWDEEDIAITGEGMIDGRGPEFFPGRNESPSFRGHWPKPVLPRPREVQFVRCRDVRLQGVTFKDSAGWTMLIRLCENVFVDGIRIDNDQRVINSDGIDFDACRHVRVGNSTFKTGDDCLILRAMREKLGDVAVCEDVVVSNCVLDSACQTIRIGCPSDDTIRNAVFRNIRASGGNGILFDYPVHYVRSYDEGYMCVSNLVFDGYTGSLRGSAVQIAVGDGVKIRGVRDILFRNFEVKSARPLRFVGNADSPLENLRFENVKVNGEGRPDGPVAPEVRPSRPLRRPVCWSWETMSESGFRIRDPFVLVDGGHYYLYESKPWSGGRGVEVRRSADLVTWTAKEPAMVLPPGIRPTAVWAPEVHRFGGKFWMFATITEEKGVRAMAPMGEGVDGKHLVPRGTWIFSSGSPTGPFKPVKLGPVPPAELQTLDGTLYVEDGKPYMVYCHEWCQTGNGTIEYAPLAPDFASFLEPPRKLLDAQSAMEGAGKVTDGPFFHRSEKTGRLYLIWSNNVEGHGYCVLVRSSASGKIAGPWTKDEILFGKNGGHGMIFKGVDGRLRITFHQPNTSPGERMRIFELDDDGERLSMKGAALSLEDGFRSPPRSAKPHTWYHMMNGNVTKEGITCDFEWSGPSNHAGKKEIAIRPVRQNRQMKTPCGYCWQVTEMI